MKKIILCFAIFCIFTFYSFSQSSTVSVFSQNGERFWLIINGEKRNSDPQTNVTVNNLSAQNYKIKVIFQDNKIPPIDKTIYTKDVDNNFHNSTYIVKMDSKGTNYVIRLNSDEIVTANVSSNNIQNQSNTQTVEQTTITTTNGSPQNVNMGIGINVNETDNGVNMNVNMGGINTGVTTSESTTYTTTITTSTTTSNNIVQDQPPVIQEQPQYVLPGYSGPIGCPWPMALESYLAAKQSISSKSFEDSKLTIAKQIVGSNCLLCSQVKEIMMLFGFEDTRLEFAKLAYKHTFDIGNYFQLNDAFKFESSIDELNQYINGN